LRRRVVEHGTDAEHVPHNTRRGGISSSRNDHRRADIIVGGRSERDYVDPVTAQLPGHLPCQTVYGRSIEDLHGEGVHLTGYT